MNYWLSENVYTPGLRRQSERVHARRLHVRIVRYEFWEIRAPLTLRRNSSARVARGKKRQVRDGIGEILHVYLHCANLIYSFDSAARKNCSTRGTAPSQKKKGSERKRKKRAKKQVEKKRPHG